MAVSGTSRQLVAMQIAVRQILMLSICSSWKWTSFRAWNVRRERAPRAVNGSLHYSDVFSWYWTPSENRTVLDWLFDVTTGHAHLSYAQTPCLFSALSERRIDSEIWLVGSRDTKAMSAATGVALGIMGLFSKCFGLGLMLYFISMASKPKVA